MGIWVEFLRKTNIITKDREIYDKLNMLHFSNEVIFPMSCNKCLGKIIKNINRRDNMVRMEKLDKYLVVTRLKPVNFNVKLRKTRFL